MKSKINFRFNFKSQNLPSSKICITATKSTTPSNPFPQVIGKRVLAAREVNVNRKSAILRRSEADLGSFSDILASYTGSPHLNSWRFGLNNTFNPSNLINAFNRGPGNNSDSGFGGSSFGGDDGLNLNSSLDGNSLSLGNTNFTSPSKLISHLMNTWPRSGH